MIDQSPFIIYSGANFDLEWRPSYVPTFNHVFRPNGAKLTRPGHRPGFAYHKKLQAQRGGTFLLVWWCGIVACQPFHNSL
jgi:hypothetical protein